MDILESFVSLENRRMNFNNNDIINSSGNANDSSSVSNTSRSHSNAGGNKTSFLIDDILFPTKLRTDSTRQVKIIYQ